MDVGTFVRELAPLGAHAPSYRSCYHVMHVLIASASGACAAGRPEAMPMSKEAPFFISLMFCLEREIVVQILYINAMHSYQIVYIAGAASVAAIDKLDSLRLRLPCVGGYNCCCCSLAALASR